MDKGAFLIKLGNRIVQLRTSKGWSQADLARASFKDPQSIERVENGKINPSIFYLKEIALALNVELAELISDI